MGNSIISTKNLNVIYNQGKSNEVKSLDNANVEIFPREYIIIHGPSGCGKSTLLYSIAGLQAPTSGSVFAGETDIFKMSKKDKTNFHQVAIGMIFQSFHLIPSLSVLENVCLPQSFMGESKAKRKEYGLKLLNRFGIAEQANKFPSQLSGGQQQRVAIARSLINNPNIILADEPVGNLDSESADNVLRILKELNEVDKKTIIMVTHNPEHIAFGDRILHMRDGKIISEEINKEKRPIKAVEEDIAKEPEVISSELRLLMRTFKNFSPQQVGGLLIPYKAKQLISHILAQLSEEQLTSAENFLKELLFKNIDMQTFQHNLDLDYHAGGAGWNKLRAKSFSDRINETLSQALALSGNYKEAVTPLAQYLIDLFKLRLSDEEKNKLVSFLRMRAENKLDAFGLQERLDAPASIGGVGLYKNTAEKVVKEVEIIMLLKYTA